MTPQRTWLIRGLKSLYLALLMALTFAGVWQSQFAEDESQWIYTSRYLTLFTKGYVGSPEWDSYWTHTQPPLARYVMGTSLKLGGYDLLKLNGPWDFSLEPTDNEAAGNKPTPEMLIWARVPMGIVSALSILLIYGIGSQVGGIAAGLGAATWMALNMRIRDLSTRAEADGLLIFFVLAGLLLTLLLISRQSTTPGFRLRDILLFAGALGVAFGLGMADKLTAVVGLIALPAAMLAVLLYRRIRERADVLRRIGEVAVATVIAGIIAPVLFFLLNPALYPSPISNSLNLFHYRDAEMQQQMLAYPTGALSEGLPRIWAGVQRPLFTYSVGTSLTVNLAGQSARTFGESLPLDAILVALGLGVTIWSVVQSIRKKPVNDHESRPASERANRVEASIVALVWTALFFAAIVATMGLDWDRYTLPLMVFAALWAGVAIGWLVGIVSRAITQRSARA